MKHSTDDFSFTHLAPHIVLNSIEKLGLKCDGRLSELNSFENRVFQIGIEDEAPIIAKFYRPGRWTTPQILEEHEFTLQLEDEEVPAIAPMRIDNVSLFEDEGYRFCLYRRQGGYPPELEIPAHLESIGRTLGRIHAFGATKLYRERWAYPFTALGEQSVKYLLDHHVPAHYTQSYYQVTQKILEKVSLSQSKIEQLPYLRLHGDCHLGNILWQDPKPFFIDFDDSLNGPQIADIWMLFSKSQDKDYNQHQLNYLLKGYEVFNDFDDDQLRYIEIFRVLRMINYASWIGTRWQDPAFQKAFFWFGTELYWQTHIRDLEIQLDRLE